MLNAMMKVAILITVGEQQNLRKRSWATGYILDKVQALKLTEAIRFHSMGRLSRDVTIQACWDADRLDLGRLGEKPDPSFLGTRIARDPDFLKAALHRSKQRFVNYYFSI